ncbi:DUF2284 domain-containing protein [Desulfogranum japonicum]|uniref:DUF2284 domain-containing protein n=1 Tax=Desulfogranum japonicum TaxID=231447 RepID=UPI0003F81F5A|nr:DUF2284 domain-containing protein [Desulfogranum japonicum]
MTSAMSDFSALVQVALETGASAAKVVSVDHVRVEQRLAGLCREPRCPSYGLAPGCPPHAMSPSAFDDMLAICVRVLVFKRDIPMKFLYDKRRLEVAKSIHRIAAQVERAAKKIGYTGASGFAAGSCKELFCPNQEACQVLEAGKSCLHPDNARPSLSAVGVDVKRLCDALGWKLVWGDRETAEKDESQTALMLGMVLLK